MRLLFICLLVLSSMFMPLIADAQEQGIVANTNGASLNCRESYPSGKVLTKLPEGGIVTVLGEAENGWYPVLCGEQQGWVSGNYLAFGGVEEQPTEVVTTPTIESPQQPSGPTTTLTVTTNGVTLNCRESYPSGRVIASLKAGSSVQTRGSAENGWWPIYCSGMEGWASGSYLGTSNAETPTQAPTVPTATPTTQPPSGGSTTLTVVNTNGANLNCRASYPSGKIVSTLKAGSTVTSVGSQVNGWWPLPCGWASASYLSVGGVTTPPPSTVQPSTSVVEYAMQYVGYPYKAAGKTPSGFDCSGFTYWVFLNTQGINIGGGTDSQARLGTQVAWDEWQAGDLLFFVGTGGTGGYYSHVGIYIGNGQMVHAQNASTGVIISSVYSNYYSTHYATARRL